MKRRSRVRTDSRSRPLEDQPNEPEELEFAFDDTDEVFPESRHTFSNNADEGWCVVVDVSFVNYDSL